MYPKVDFWGRPREEEKKVRKVVNNNEMHYIYVGKRHSKAH
jgi:hypothetical protein